MIIIDVVKKIKLKLLISIIKYCCFFNSLPDLVKTKKCCRILIPEEYYQQLFIRSVSLIGPVSYVFKENKTVFRKKFKIIKIGLFGSYEANRSSDLSDIDLIVEFEPYTGMLFEKKMKMKELLKRRFSVDVDICREKYLKNYF